MPARPRVAILHQGFVPRYRVRLFELLAESADVDYVVFHGDPPRGIGHAAAKPPFAFAHRRVHNRELVVRGRRAVYQPLVREVVRDYDAVVLGAHLSFASSHAVRAAFEALRRPVVYWGHAGHVKKEPRSWPGPVARCSAGAKARLARSVDAYLAYTAGGAAKLVDGGVDPARVFVLGNTIDMDLQRALHAEMTQVGEPAVRAQLGLDPGTPVIVFVGRFIPGKRIDDVVAAARMINDGRDRPAEFVLIGGGPELDRIRAAAADAPGVRVLFVQPDREVARWLLCATAIANPGAVGLGANHAFAHGVPVVTRAGALHGPEIEYVEHDVNGIVVDGDLRAYADALAGLIESPARRERLSAGAYASADTLGLERMAAAFEDGVRTALASRAPRRATRKPGRPLVAGV